MSENIKKLSNKELEIITQLRQISQNIIFEYGNIEMARKNLLAREEKADDAFQALRKKEQELAKELQEKYGVGSINIEEGTFIPG